MKGKMSALLASIKSDKAIKADSLKEKTKTSDGPLRKVSEGTEGSNSGRQSRTEKEPGSGRRQGDGRKQ